MVTGHFPGNGYSITVRMDSKTGTPSGSLVLLFFCRQLSLDLYLALPVTGAECPYETAFELFIEERDGSEDKGHATGKGVLAVGCKRAAVDKERTALDHNHGPVVRERNRFGTEIRAKEHVQAGLHCLSCLFSVPYRKRAVVCATVTMERASSIQISRSNGPNFSLSASRKAISYSAGRVAAHCEANRHFAPSGISFLSAMVVRGFVHGG